MKALAETVFIGEIVLQSKIAELAANHFEAIKDDLDLTGKKGLVKLIFRAITVLDGEVKKIELYEPFKSLYEGVRIKCQLKENQRLATIPESVSTLELSDAR